MTKTAYYLIAGCTCLALVLGLVQVQWQGSSTAAAAEPSKADRSADEAAIRKLSAEFTAAIARGDAQAVAGFWTAEGEYVAGNGTTIQGRDAIQQAYVKRLKDSGHPKIEVEVDAIRFVSQDNAVEEGTARVEKGTAAPTTSRFSILYARENGTWRIAMLHERPADSAGLHDLDWLVGTWTARTPRGEVRTTYTWADNKKFLNMKFTIKNPDGTTSGKEVIASDPRTGGLHSWLFEDSGGFGEAGWSRDGKRWVLASSGVEADGTEVSATNIVTRLNNNTFLWQSVERSIGGEQQPDIGPVRVTRAK